MPGEEELVMRPPPGGRRAVDHVDRGDFALGLDVGPAGISGMRLDM